MHIEELKNSKMQKIKQVLFSFLTFVASFYFLFWVLGAIFSIPFDIDSSPWISILPDIVSFLLAGYLAFKVWNKTGTKTKSNIGTYILYGAMGLGVSGFLIGFFGPLIFMPGANQGPLLGIFITGPGGVVLGAIGGAILWEVKKIQRKKAARSNPDSFD